MNRKAEKFTLARFGENTSPLDKSEEVTQILNYIDNHNNKDDGVAGNDNDHDNEDKNDN